MNFLEKEIWGWGEYPRAISSIYRPEKNKHLTEILKNQSHRHYIMRGLGRSYGDPAINKKHGVISNLLLNRMISFDADTGILECEGGTSFEEILRFFIPKGFFLPVTPGTQFVTVAGAIANDVHGKNHHVDGSIAQHILDFDLLTAQGSILPCSPKRNSEIFWATVGGIGLTGIILKARLQLIPIESSYIDVHYEKAANLEEALKLFEQDDKYQYSVAWIDCMATGNSLGRSVLMRGNHATHQSAQQHAQDLFVKEKSKLSVPFHLPSFVLNPFSIKVFNSLYYSKYKHDSLKQVEYDSFFYPLDSIQHWNRMYGSQGFIQYQPVFPPETSSEGLIALLQKLGESKRSSFLAVLKKFGEGNDGYLSFPKKGFTLALDIPVRKGVFSFLQELDELVLTHGGRIYLAKDATLHSDVFKEMYPKLEKFKEIKNKLDPNQIFSSSMSKRLKITE